MGAEGAEGNARGEREEGGHEGGRADARAAGEPREGEAGRDAAGVPLEGEAGAAPRALSVNRERAARKWPRAKAPVHFSRMRQRCYPAILAWAQLAQSLG